MCDDFFEDHLDENIFDPDNDFEEDLIDDHSDIEDSEFSDEESINEEPLENEGNRVFDMAEKVIFSSMIIGNAIEDSLDEKRRRERLKSIEKRNK